MGDFMCRHRCLICIVTFQIIFLVLVLAYQEGSSANVVQLIGRCSWYFCPIEWL